jgi:hypothetical protein
MKVLGYRQYDNSIEMEHILCRAGRNYKFSSDKLSFDRNKTEVSSQENGYSFEHNLISSGAYGRDKEMSVNKFMQLWEYGYFVVQELDNVYTKTVGQPWDLTRMGTATDELKLDIAIKATGIDVIDITEDYRYSTYSSIVSYRSFKNRSICLEYSQ